MTKKKSYFGSVSISASNTSSRTAEIINDVLDGFLLQEDESGHFEGYPAYTATIESIVLELVGNLPDDDDANFYSLTLKCIKIDPVEVGTKISSKFFTTLPTGLPVEKNGYINISTYLCNYILANTSLNCAVSWVT